MPEEATKKEPKVEHPIAVFMSRIAQVEKDLKEAQQAQEGNDFDPGEALKWDVGPLLVDQAKLWFEAQRWNTAKINELVKSIAGIAGKITEMDAGLVSLSGALETMSNAEPDLEYETQITAEDAEELTKFAMAAMKFISDAPGDAEIKQALLTKGQAIVQTIQENTLQAEEDDDDADG
jgi:hypothetical protein